MKKTVNKLGIVTKRRDDADDMPLATMQSIGLKENTYKELAPYGFASNAPTDSLVASFEFLDESNNLYGIAFQPWTRTRNLKPGEVAVSNQLTKSKVFFDQDGNVIIEVTKDKIVTVAEDMSITVNGDTSITTGGSTTITSTGDINAQSDGDIVATAQGDIIINSQGAEVNIISDGDTSITAGGDVNVTANDATINVNDATINGGTTINGDLRVSGSITDDYNANAVTLKTLRDTYNIHTHEQTSSGPQPRNTLAPNQPVLLSVFEMAALSFVLDAIIDNDD